MQHDRILICRLTHAHTETLFEHSHPNKNQQTFSVEALLLWDVTVRLHISISVVYEFIVCVCVCVFVHIDMMLRLFGVLLSDPCGYIPIKSLSFSLDKTKKWWWLQPKYSV